MKLEDKFFHSFFYPFFMGLLFNVIIIIITSIIFANNYIDRKTSENMIELEKNNAKINLNTIKISISAFLLKIQVSMNEVISSYQKTAKKIKLNPDLANNLDDKYLKCALDLNDSEIGDNIDDLNYMAYWFLDAGVNKNELNKEKYSTVKKQLVAFNNVIPNLFSVFAATNSSSFGFYFYYESTELYLSFPLLADYLWDFTKILDNYEGNPVWCTNETGDIYNVYKVRCRDFYINIQKAKTDIFDYNSFDNKDRTIFVTEFYYQSGMDFTNVFTMCIQFDEPISEGKAYICADIGQNSLIFNFDNINSKLNGFFLVSPVGFNRAFYFPQSIEYAYTPSENIFKWDKTFYLEEKTYFFNHIQKLMTSNYIKYLDKGNNSFLDEVYINGQNSTEQFFYIKGEAFNYSIYPIVFENIEGKKEHILNLIYIYNQKLLIQRIKRESSIALQIMIEIIIFAVFGSGLLYLIVLSFNILAKYIVIPIKNVNYMLKGINIGGENRLEYLDFLKRKQDENIEMLEKIYMNEDKNNERNNEEENGANNNLLNKEENENNLHLINNEENNENQYPDDVNNEADEEVINSNINYDQKYDEESEFIEKETVFYNFDENLLQFRPLEVDHLIKSLIELKGAETLTKSDYSVEHIIDYSNSEDIFKNYKNKEGETICQSNIGNLQSQLRKFDKAIYHLAISLRDNKFQKFLKKGLFDELDESDNLLFKITSSFNKNRKIEKNNLLAEKQQNNTKDVFSQKVIGVFIGSRYPRLINAFFKFFKLLQKSQSEIINEQFMNTSFHNINFFHKTLIQYIYLSYVKNDLIKIGESILDYLEFLIKFKFKTSSDNEYILNIKNIHLPELKEKRSYKRYIYKKIVDWFILFDDYVEYVKNYTQLLEDKTILENFSENLNSSNDELNSENQSFFLLRINIQREEYLKGKFAMKCKNYCDALYYFTRVSQKISIVLDGLLKKKALKKILKIIKKINTSYHNYGINNKPMEQNILEYEKVKKKFMGKRNNQFNKNEVIDSNYLKEKNLTFAQEIENFQEIITNEIKECCAKNAKDIIVILDFNIYNPDSNSSNEKIESFIDQTHIILNDYLSNNDRLSVFIYSTQYKILCSLLAKNEIDFNSFSNDLNNYKMIIFKEKEEYSNTSEDNNMNELIGENGLENMEKTKIEFQQHFSDPQSKDSFNTEESNQSNISDILKGFVETINYSKKYLKMKEGKKNEKYLIIFTDLFNYYKTNDEIISSNLDNIKEDKNIIFLLVGKNDLNNDAKRNNNLLDDEDENHLKEILMNKYDKKSQIIYYENMKQIKNILSNNVIRDDIIYPNEIYK